MCTSLTLPTPRGTNLFGRTLDLDTHFGESVTLTPRRYPFHFADCYPLTHHHALLGMAAVIDGYPLYAEAMNEKGLCMAGLRFAKNALYAPSPREGRFNLAPWELIPYLLGTCATVEEARAALADICVVDKPFSSAVGTAPLHWHITDADPAHGGLILEVTAAGMKIYGDRPDGAGVLANDPAYSEQMAALRACPAIRGDESGLPGDYSSPSRFARAATLRRWWMEQTALKAAKEAAKEAALKAAKDGADEAGKDGGGDYAVAQFFRILGAVSPTAGAVMTPEGRCHRTLYTCCMDAAAGAYFYHTEADPTIRKISFSAQDLNGEAPFIPNPDRISHSR